jgi:hypothetical protein
MTDVRNSGGGGRFWPPSDGLQTYAHPYPRFVADEERGRRLGAHEVVEVVDVKGMWAHVAVDGEIVGWVDRQRLQPAGVLPEAKVVVPPRDRLPAPAPAARAATFAVTLDAVLAAVGSLGIVVGAFAGWTRGIARLSSFKVALPFLWDFRTTADNPKLGWFLVAIGLCALVSSFVAGARRLRGALALLAIGAVALFCVQLARTLPAHGPSFTDIAGPGVLVTGAAALVLLVSSVVLGENQRRFA